MATETEKRELADLLVQVHGIDYAFGWLKSAYAHRVSENIEDDVYRCTRDQLLVDMLKKDNANG